MSALQLLRVRPPSDERKELFELSDLLRNLALDYYNRVEVEVRCILAILRSSLRN